MSYKYSFADNATYSADDVNKITKRLVTSGIEDSFENGVAYNVSKFNEAGKQLYTSGVVPESCATLKVTSVSAGKVLINPGLAFFEDGSVIEIEAGGEELAYTNGVVNYVYLKNDLESANISFPCCTTEQPVGDFVMLATIDAKGNIKDKRTYARGKLPGYQSAAMSPLFIDEKVSIEITSSSIAKGTVEFDVGANNFKYIFAVGKEDTSYRYPSLAVYDIEEGSIISFYELNSEESNLKEDTMYLYFDRYKKRITAIPSLANGKLKLSIEAFSPGSLGTVGTNISVDVQLVLV